MKDIDVQKIRTAILTLQNSGAKESAQAVWDLLDNYVAQKPKPLVMRQAVAKSWMSARGASAAANAPMCEAERWNYSTPDCYKMGIGHMVNQDTGLSVLMCQEHSMEFSREGADWVQTFFGDENSVDDITEYEKRMTISAKE